MSEIERLMILSRVNQDDKHTVSAAQFNDDGSLELFKTEGTDRKGITLDADSTYLLYRYLKDIFEDN